MNKIDKKVEDYLKRAFFITDELIAILVDEGFEENFIKKSYPDSITIEIAKMIQKEEHHGKINK